MNTLEFFLLYALAILCQLVAYKLGHARGWQAHAREVAMPPVTITGMPVHYPSTISHGARISSVDQRTGRTEWWMP